MGPKGNPCGLLEGNPEGDIYEDHDVDGQTILGIGLGETG
jgi:hypothetical protein